MVISLQKIKNIRLFEQRMEVLTWQKVILLVEDDREISQLVTSHLEQENFIVYRAFDGEEALTLLEKNEVDLILLDLMLPKLSGMDLLKRIRATSVIPVLDHFR